MLPNRTNFNGFLNPSQELAGKYATAFQGDSVNPSVISNENELLAFDLSGASQLFSRGLNRVRKIANQYVDNVPGLAVAEKQKKSADPLDEHLTHLMLSGGVTGLGALGAKVLNAGSTQAGTLEEAKKLGYYK